MTIQEIIDYLSKTPGNTNPAVISTMVEEYAGGGGSSSDVGFVVFTYDPSDQTYSADTSFSELTQYDSIIGVLVMGGVPYAAIGEPGDDNCWFEFAVLTTPSTYELTYYNDNSIEVEEYWLSGPMKTVNIINNTGVTIKVSTAESGTKAISQGNQELIKLRASINDHAIIDFLDVTLADSGGSVSGYIVSSNSEQAIIQNCNDGITLRSIVVANRDASFTLSVETKTEE